MISLLIDYAGTQPILTERLILRPFMLTDAESVFRNWASDRELQLMYQEPAYETLEDVKGLLSEYVENYESNSYFRWAIIEKESNECIGQIALYGTFQRSRSVEYCIGKSFQSKGYATESLRAVVKYGFEQIKLHRIEADRRSDNIQSGRVLEKCGFSYEGTCVDKTWANGRFYNLIVYGLTEDAWKRKNDAKHDINGPVKTPVRDEVIDIRNAPQYDIQAARALINKMFDAAAMMDSIPADCTDKGASSKSKAIQWFGDTDKPFDLEILSQEINAIEKNQHDIGFLMIDLNTLKGVAYNIDSQFCTQSSIKGIYIGSLLESNYDLLAENGQNMRDAIVNSDNDAYLSLCRAYGFEHIRNWAMDVGVDPYIVQIPFPRLMTVRDMAKFWTKMYEFVNGEKDSSNFAKYFAKTLGSAISNELGKEYPVQTKAGWEWNPQSNKDRCACNDCGIVYSKNGPYIEVVFTDIPWTLSEPNPIQRVVRILDSIHCCEM